MEKQAKKAPNEELAALQTKHGDLLIKLKTWHDLLSCEGINSKKIVKQEIEKVLKEEQNNER